MKDEKYWLTSFFVIITGELVPEKVHYCERFLELLIDLEALLPTRRFFNTVLDDSHLVVRCKIAPLTKRSEGNLFKQVSFSPSNCSRSLEQAYFDEVT